MRLFYIALPGSKADCRLCGRRRVLPVGNYKPGIERLHDYCCRNTDFTPVIRLNASKGYGFIRTQEGRELYFHRNSVLNDDFDRLGIGTGVRYAAAAGDEGPKASTIQIIEKPVE